MTRYFGSRTVIALVVANLSMVLLTNPSSLFAATSAADEYVEDAQKYIKKGDTNAAVIQLKNALQKDPNNVTARKMLGEIYLRVGNGPAAAKELSAAIRRGAKDKDTQILLARAYLLMGKFDDVLKTIPDDVSDPKIRLSVLLARARAHLGLRQFEESEKAFLDAEKLKPEDVRPKVGAAQVLVNRGKLKEAEKKIDAALEVDANSADALVLKGELRRLSRDLEGAITAFDRALSGKKINIPARLGRAAALIDLNKDEAAQADILAVFQSSPRNPLATYLSALSLSKKKDFKGAQEALQQAGTMLDNHMPSIFLRGAVHYVLNQLEQATVDLSRYVSAVPGNVRARKLLGATLVRKNDPQKAIDILLPLQGTKGEDAQVMSLLGSAYMRTGKFSEGAALFEKAASAAPEVSSIRTQLALSRLAQGASEKAVGDLEAAINLDPDAKQASILLTLVHLRKREFDAALKTALVLQKSMPDNPLADNLIGAAQLGKGQTAEARKTFEAALKKKANFHPARMNLAQLDLRDKNVKGAISHYETIVKEDPKHVGAMMALAGVAASEKRPGDVVSWLRKAGDANPKSVAPRLRLIQHHGQLREFTRALSIARDLKSKVPNNPQVLEAMGRAEIAAGKPLEATTTFRELVSVSPKSPRAQQLLGGALAASDDQRGAKEAFEAALALDEKFAPALRALVEVESRAGNVEGALKIAAKIDKMAPKSAVGKMLAGDVYMRAKQYDKAVQFYDEALKREDTGAIAIRRYNAARGTGNLDKALTMLQSWVDNKDDPSVRHILASSYISNNKFDDAIRESEKLLTKTPKNPVLLNNLAWLYSKKRDKRAVDYGERALKAAPKSPAVMDTLGWILYEQNQNDRALKLLQDAHNAAPKQGDIAYHLAASLNKSGKEKEARRVLERTLKQSDKFSEAVAAKKLLKRLGG
jgi:putative PEP-CTERM system TPR-repeat lipoprotein